MWFLVEIAGIGYLIFKIYQQAGFATALLLGYLAFRSIGVIIHISKMADIVDKMQKLHGTTDIRRD